MEKNSDTILDRLMHDPNVKIKFLSDAGAYGFVFYALDTSTNNRICVIKIVLLDANNTTDEDSEPLFIREVGSKKVGPFSRFKEETDNSIILQRDGNGVDFYGSVTFDIGSAMILIRHLMQNKDGNDEATLNYIDKMVAFLDSDKVTHIGLFFTEPLDAIDLDENYLTFSIESAVNLLKLACAGKIASDLKPANSIFAKISELGPDKQTKLHEKRQKAINLTNIEEEIKILKKIQVSEGTSISIDAGILIDRAQNFQEFDRGLVNKFIQTNNPSDKKVIGTKRKEVTSVHGIEDPVIRQFITDSHSINILEIQKYHVATMLDILYYDNPGTFWWLGSIIGDRENPRYIDKIGAIWCLLRSSSGSSRKSSRKSYSKRRRLSRRGGKTRKYKVKTKYHNYQIKKSS